MTLLLNDVLGPEFGLVRGLYFDKPPDATWSLPWHQDKTIAVKFNDKPSQRFRRPTKKAGVPHVEAPDDVLREMLTLRIHFDNVDAQNGALQVLPGSHRAHRFLNHASASVQHLLRGRRRARDATVTGAL